MPPHRRSAPMPADYGDPVPPRAPARSGPRSGRRSTSRQRVEREPESEIGCCMKYSLFGFNVLFWLLGGLILFIGSFAFVEKRGWIQDLETASKVPVDPSFILVVLGLTIFVVAFFGCVGSLRENNCFLVIFSLILALVLTAEIITGILVYIHRDWVRDKSNNFILQNIKAYRDDPDLQDIIDGIQSELECCGGESFDDWDNNMYFNCTGTDRDQLIPEACGVPFSCCKREDKTQVVNTQCGFGARREVNFNIHTKGCVKKMMNWLRDNIVPIAGIVLFVLLIQVFGVFISLTLRSDIKRQRSRWLYAEAHAGGYPLSSR